MVDNLRTLLIPRPRFSPAFGIGDLIPSLGIGASLAFLSMSGLHSLSQLSNRSLPVLPLGATLNVNCNACRLMDSAHGCVARVLVLPALTAATVRFPFNIGLIETWGVCSISDDHHCRR